MTRPRVFWCALVAALWVGPAGADWDDGIAAFKTRDYTRAVSEFQAYVERVETEAEGAIVDEEFYSAYFMLGESLARARRKSDAIAPFYTAMRLKPSDLGTKLALGQTLFRLNRCEPAVRVLESVDLADLPWRNRTAVKKMIGVCKERGSGLDL